jgi:YesN/AraC family two-component response regulator
VVVHSGYQLDAVRAHLEAGFERLTEPLLTTGRLDRKSYDEILASIDHAAVGASTVAALVASYRNVVALVERAIESPTSARQHRSTQRARKFMRDHAGEPLTLAQVARVAGFAPDYFSRLLKRDEGMTFDHYLQAIRLARAKQTLATTTLSVERVARLSGFQSRTYFQQVFRQQAGMTPIEYRQSRPG